MLYLQSTAYGFAVGRLRVFGGFRGGLWYPEAAASVLDAQRFQALCFGTEALALCRARTCDLTQGNVCGAVSAHVTWSLCEPGTMWSLRPPSPPNVHLQTVDVAPLCAASAAARGGRHGTGIHSTDLGPKSTTLALSVLSETDSNNRCVCLMRVPEPPALLVCKRHRRGTVRGYSAPDCWVHVTTPIMCDTGVRCHHNATSF